MVKASCTIEDLPMPSDFDLYSLLISYFKILMFQYSNSGKVEPPHFL
jgi:hypothetical protein